MTGQRDGHWRWLAVAKAVPASLLLIAVCAPAGGAAAGPRNAPHRELAAVLVPLNVRARPVLNSRVLTLIDARRPITGERTVLPVIGRMLDRSGRSWLQVRLPGRTLTNARPPSVGWITAKNTRRSTPVWRIVVNISARRVLAYRNGGMLRSFQAIVGKRSTPTPKGQYFVEENVRLPPNAVGAPFALATSARSHVLQEFAGGPGQIALHGLDNIGGRLGTTASHGCIRLSDSAITWLAARIRPGTPITIR